MSVARCKTEVSSKEFIDWCVYLTAIEPNEFHRIDHYLAQIAAWIKRSSFKNPQTVRDQDFMIKFKTGTEQQDIGQKEQAARSFFGRLLAMGKAVKKRRLPSHVRNEPR